MDKAIHSADQDVLCRLLRDSRQAADLTQQQVADALGVPQSFVSKYESGERRLDIIELRQVCDACGMPLVAFVQELEAALKQRRNLP